MMKTTSLPAIILAVIQNKGTEKPFSGEYDQFGDTGTYLCRQCGAALFRSSSKFHSGCGWPSFDEEILNAVERVPDQDGRRVEIICARCRAHLGHVFQGEKFTDRNTRHCVNSLSLDFVADLSVKDTEEAIFAAGCFWGVEYYFKQLKGVLKAQVGYTGGSKEHPSYQDVCNGNTGHYEAVRVVYDPSVVDHKKVTQYFFEIHDGTQNNGQGPDIGSQYKSAIFYYDDTQKKVAEEVIQQLEEMRYQIATKVLPVTTFWPAENYHQDYYTKNFKQPYCHRYTKIF